MLPNYNNESSSSSTSTISKINSKNYKTIFKFKSYSKPIRLETTTGDITFENHSLTSQLLIETRDGNIYGNLFQSHKSELNIKTDGGYVNLNLNITKIYDDDDNDLQSSKVKATTVSGNINFGINIEEGIKSPNVDISSDYSNISVGFVSCDLFFFSLQ